ncbi:protein disulfide-isomerase c17h9.14c-related [Holotrichia oblita]|uniref:Protein disulfide-isomerase c17h9.14c-related n=1 Tax=Holotrichia oblita TaxID=644536 RepID=A0ACB9SWA2_HOLOL|nr:protein disulfide-isomerase c17h9.14c-related [Holotrichia oblita]
MKTYYLITVFLIFVIPNQSVKPNNNKNVVVENVADIKDFKKVLRTKTNILVCFTNNVKQSTNIVKIFKEAAVTVKGQGTMVLVDCGSDAKKLCKKLKVNPEFYVLKHYKDGEFNKDYDRKETVQSMVNFMRDPTGDLPWEEDATANNVLHISDAAYETEYAAAASELHGEAVLAAIDVNRPENAIIRTQYNISGFPTLLYYENGHLKYQYEGENTKVGLVSFMKNPHEPPPKIKEPEWSDTDSEIVHLTTNSFDPVIKEEVSVLVMFYAPWCGHCKRMKPEYEKAAAQMKTDKIPGMLAAVDATKEQSIATRYQIKGYPTVKYFSYGEVKFDVNVRESAKIVDFMRNPKEAPAPPPKEVHWSEQPTDVIHLNEESFKPFLKKKKHVLVMFYTPWCGHCKKAKPEFSKAAEHFRDDPKVEFAAVDCTVHQSLCNSNDVKGYPTIKYFSYYKSEKQYSGGRTAADFIRFMTDPEQPMVAKPKKSVSNEWLHEKSVVHLTDNTFRNEINSNEPILVMFYAPWCAHCKRMKPDYTSVAQQLKDEGLKCKLAMLDCTTNPLIAEEYAISGFPTLKLFKNGKYVADYRGTRSQEDIVSFMKTHTSNTKDEL